MGIDGRKQKPLTSIPFGIMGVERMPRRVPVVGLRSTEENLARRIEWERKRRGWSGEGLAERMRRVGYPLRQSAIWKIENGRPRRRISLDEANAFASVFDLALDELVRPPGAVAFEHVNGLLKEYLAVSLTMTQVQEDLDAIRGQLVEALGAYPEVAADIRAGLDHPINEGWREVLGEALAEADSRGEHPETT